MAQERRPYHRTTMKTDTRLSIKEKKLTSKKLAGKMTSQETVELLMYISRNTAFLKHHQNKQLSEIMAKANSNEPINTRDNINLLEMRSTIRVYLAASESNVDSHSKRLERYSVTFDHKNTL